MGQKLVAVYGTREGAGKTAVALELAGAYCLRRKKTLLVDMALGGGQVAGLLKLPPEPNLGQWLQEIDELMREGRPYYEIEFPLERVTSLIQQHYTGLFVLAASPRDYPGRAAEMVEVVLSHLKRTDYEVVVFDTRSVVREYVLCLLSQAGVVLLVEDTYRYHLQHAAETLERLREAGLDTGNFYLVCNRLPSLADEAPQEAAVALGIPLAGVLPEHPRLNQRFGPRPVSYEELSRYTQALEELVARLEQLG
ncbi:AAA family ATPase [Desulfovirgula thermocuniculi]|uniref:AAA family ATPase n=1 Tax=Desulfovirgula thermocuniculi TaxID=348842 RepID=UPI0004087148|nr:hypothetical protein [Desulfovirgula thermocuniculi]